jgi:uncharacterized protein YdhG (YjbR/CyaY superfamily)
MKGQLRASTPAEYLAQLEEPRKTEVAALDALIRKVAPKLEPFIHIGILAYGLPKAKIGKGCVRFKRLGDLDPAALKKLIREGAAESKKARAAT